MITANILKVIAALAVSFWLAGESPARSDDRGFDPSGTWMGMHGPLALMRSGDTLSFSYSAVFGATAPYLRRNRRSGICGTRPLGIH